MPGSVLLMGGDDRLAEVVAAGLERAGGEALVHLASTDEALAAVEAPDGVEAVCVGPQVAKPLGHAQRIAATDRELAVVLVVPGDEHGELERQRLFTPFLGPDVSCRPLEEAAILGAELSDAAQRTRARRRHRAILATATVSQEAFSSPQTLSGRHLGGCWTGRPSAP